MRTLLSLAPAEEALWRLGGVLYGVFMPPGSAGSEHDDAVLAIHQDGVWRKVRGLGRQGSRELLIQAAISEGLAYGFGVWEEAPGGKVLATWVTGPGRGDGRVTNPLGGEV